MRDALQSHLESLKSRHFEFKTRQVYSFRLSVSKYCIHFDGTSSSVIKSLNLSTSIKDCPIKRLVKSEGTSCLLCNTPGHTAWDCNTQGCPLTSGVDEICIGSIVESARRMRTETLFTLVTEIHRELHIIMTLSNLTIPRDGQEADGFIS